MLSDLAASAAQTHCEQKDPWHQHWVPLHPQPYNRVPGAAATGMVLYILKRTIFVHYIMRGGKLLLPTGHFWKTALRQTSTATEGPCRLTTGGHVLTETDWVQNDDDSNCFCCVLQFGRAGLQWDKKERKIQTHMYLKLISTWLSCPYGTFQSYHSKWHDVLTLLSSV